MDRVHQNQRRENLANPGQMDPLRELLQAPQEDILPADEDPPDDEIEMLEIKEYFKKMLENLWFAATMQLQRHQADVGIVQDVDHVPDGDQDYLPILEATSNTLIERIMGLVNIVPDEDARTYVVPSLGMECNVVSVPAGAEAGRSQKNFAMESQYFDTKQTLRLHMNISPLQMERDALRGLQDLRQSWGQHTQWGNLSTEAGPVGFKGMFKPEVEIANIELCPHGLAKAMLPYTDGDTRVTPIICCYETRWRAADKASNLRDEQENFLKQKFVPLQEVRSSQDKKSRFRTVCNSLVRAMLVFVLWIQFFSPSLSCVTS